MLPRRTSGGVPGFRNVCFVDADEPVPVDIELSERLAPLTAEDNPWRYSALELTALLSGRTGDKERERDIFTRLFEDPGAPAGIRARASEMLKILGG